MKLLLISDTHGRREELEALLKRYAGEVRMVCHMGDHADDLLKFQPAYPTLQMATVAGNCDYGMNAPRELILTVADKRILMIHGHQLGVKQGLQRLAYYAREKGVDACFFGHTHQPAMFTAGSVFVMNPGSLTEPRGRSHASYGLVEISAEGEIKGEIICTQTGG
ncbi:MAG: metallophosphoesterase [Defluviitaleaceae bacterium]|nr:metallophosphoesterase [Defluviitaleaceae bacterium]